MIGSGIVAGAEIAFFSAPDRRREAVHVAVTQDFGLSDALDPL